MTEERKEKKEEFSLEEGLEQIEQLLERLGDEEVSLTGVVRVAERVR